MLNYWAEVIRTDDLLLHSTFSMLRQDADQGNTYNNLNWAFHVKTTFDQLGFSNVWLDQDNIAGIPMLQIRQRLLDQYNQTIISSLNESQNLKLYRRFKNESRTEKYLDCIYENKHKISLSRFRLSSHNLMIETGRCNGMPRDERLCNFCNMRIVEGECLFSVGMS